MFTGLISTTGTITHAHAESGGLQLRIRCDYAPESLQLGESIAVNGCCLTVTGMRDWGLGIGGKDDSSAPIPNPQSLISFYLSTETLACTAPNWKQGARVNLERALKAGDALGGHLVSGHVDGIGELLSITPYGEANEMRFRAPDTLARFIAPKGSITIDGVSLTVNTVHETEFTVMVIPHTLSHTILGEASPRTPVNLEADLIARYVERLLGRAS